MLNEWAEELAARFRVPVADILAKPTAILDFPPETVRVELMDSSSVEFRRAFAVISEGKRAIAVFTEHCGHHVFPYHEAKVLV